MSDQPHDAMTPPRTLLRVERGEAGRVLRELRAQDFVFTVLEREQPSSRLVRIRFSGNGFLRTHAPYPTMWVRLWFADRSGTGAGHQRAYTLVDPDVPTDTFWLEFAIHDGSATAWALGAQPGDQVEASLYGSEPSLPGCDDVDHHLLVGDPASLPAINSLLDALSPAPTTVVLEWTHPDDRALPVRLRDGDALRWVRRERDGGALLDAVDEVLADLSQLDDPALGRTCRGDRPNLLAVPADCPRVFAWGACDTVTTRALTKKLRAAGLAKNCVKTLGYWLPSTQTAALTG